MKSTSLRIQEELKKGDSLSLVSLIDMLIAFAYESRSSDIHIDPREDDIRIRLRIDGVLQHTHTLPRSIYAEVIGRIKVQASLRGLDTFRTPDWATALQDMQYVPVLSPFAFEASR